MVHAWVFMFFFWANSFDCYSARTLSCNFWACQLDYFRSTTVCKFWVPQLLVSAKAQALCLVFLGLVNLSVSCIFWVCQLDCYHSTTVAVAVAATVAVTDAVADAVVDAVANELQILFQFLCFFC